MSEPSESLLEFPCRFPIKVMGRSETGFRELVVELVTRHASLVEEDAVSVNPSQNGNFLAVTVYITAESRAQLDHIYQDLTDHEQILMAL